jgi:hypothetical protein
MRRLGLDRHLRTLVPSERDIHVPLVAWQVLTMMSQPDPSARLPSTIGPTVVRRALAGEHGSPAHDAVVGIATDGPLERAGRFR